MTLLPSDSWEIEGVSGDRYQVPVRCQAPGCQRYSDHLHHLWRRSFLGGDYWWVRLPGGLVVRNIVGLCIPHHEDVTGKPGAGHVAWIRWIPGTQEFRWMEEESTSGKWRQVGTLSLPAPTKTASDGTPGREAERCPVCGKLKRQTVEHEPGAKRPRKSWTIQVPADEEDGAAVLDELVEGCAEVFGHDEYTSKLRRYFTVVAALTVVLQNRELIQVEIEP